MFVCFLDVFLYKGIFWSVRLEIKICIVNIVLFKWLMFSFFLINDFYVREDL